MYNVHRYGNVEPDLRVERFTSDCDYTPSVTLTVTMTLTMTVTVPPGWQGGGDGVGSRGQNSSHITVPL